MSAWKDSLKGIVPWSRSGGRSSSSLSPSRAGFEEHPFGFLQKQMKSLFDDFFSHLGGESGGFVPKVSVTEDAEKVYVSVELPGMDQKDVELTLTDEVLTIRGEKRVEHEQREGKNVFAMERSYGFFQRSIPLSSEIDTDKVDAVFKNGVLNVSLSKTPAAQAHTRAIPIRS